MFYDGDLVIWERARSDRRFLVIMSPREDSPGIVSDESGMRYIVKESELKYGGQ